MTVNGADYAFEPHPMALALAQAGFRYIYRYIGAGSGSKLLTADEVAQLHANGLAVGLYVEGAASDIFGGRGEGQLQASEALSAAMALGAPGDTILVFAADEDINTTNIHLAIEYFRGVNDILPPSRVGAYCDTDLAPVLQQLGLATLFIKPAALSWSPGQFPYDVVQLPGEIAVGGGYVDSLQSDAMPRGLWTSDTTNGENDMPIIIRCAENGGYYQYPTPKWFKTEAAVDEFLAGYGLTRTNIRTVSTLNAVRAAYGPIPGDAAMVAAGSADLLTDAFGNLDFGEAPEPPEDLAAFFTEFGKRMMGPTPS